MSENTMLPRRRFLSRAGGIATAAVVGAAAEPVSAQSDATDDWPMYRGGAANTGVSRGTAPGSDVRQRWQYETEGGIPSSPIVVDGTVYVGSEDHYVYAIDDATGEEKWRTSTGSDVVSSPAVVDGTVFVSDTGGFVRALDDESGDEQWQAEVGRQVHSSPTVVDGTVYVGAVDGGITALNAASGTERWNVSTRDPVYASLAVVDGTAYAASDGGTVFAIDVETGEVAWETDLLRSIKAPPSVVGGSLYVASETNRIFALDASSGDEEWAFKVDLQPSATPVVTDDTVFVPSTDSYLYALDSDTGNTEYRFNAGLELYSAVGIGRLVCLATAQRIRMIDSASSSDRWVYRPGSSGKPSLAVANGQIYVATSNGLVYVLSDEEWSTEAASSGQSTATPDARATQTPASTPTPPPESTPAAQSNPAGPESDSGGVSLLNPSVIAPMGGAALLLMLYLRRRSGDGDDAPYDAVQIDDVDETDSSATAPPATPDADELLGEAEDALAEGYQAQEEGRSDDAEDRFREAVSKFSQVASMDVDQPTATRAQDGMNEAEAALADADSGADGLGEIRELLTAAESDMESGIEAFVDDQRTVARVRFRQAKGRYDEALNRLDDVDRDSLDLDASVPDEESRPDDALESIPGLGQDAVEALRAAGYDSRAAVEGASTDDIAADADVADEAAARVKMWYLGRSDSVRRFDTVEDVEARRDAADLGHRLCQ